MAAKFAAVLPHLDERQRRLVMGAEARVLGHGGIKLVARAAGVSAVTVSKGVAELEAGEEPLGRIRRKGGGRKPVTEADPAVLPRCWRWWSPPRGAIRNRRCGGRRSRCATWLRRWPLPGTRFRRTRWLNYLRRRGLACRLTPRRSKAASTRIVTPSSAISTSKPRDHQTAESR